MRNDKKQRKFSVSLKVLHTILVILSLSLSVSLVVITGFAETYYTEINHLSDGYVKCTIDIQTLDETSDYLTSRSREYVVMGNSQAAIDYITEINEHKNREKALENVEKYFADSDVLEYLQDALNNSNELANREKYAMRLAGDVYGLTVLPEEIQNYAIDAIDSALSLEEKKDKAISMLFDETYSGYKNRIDNNIRTGLNLLVEASSARKDDANNNLVRVLVVHEVMGILMLVIILALGLVTYFLLLAPLKRSIEAINENRRMDVHGARELTFVARAYNEMFEARQKQQQALQYEVSHDILTGISNRYEYTSACNDLADSNILYIIGDVDKFKGINDNFGHAVGDQVLAEVANRLKETFMKSDRVFRVGGDEFIIFVLDVESKDKKAIASSLDKINSSLAKKHKTDSFPLVSLSFGVVEKTKNMSFEDAYRRADKALYKVKESGGCGYSIDEDNK